MHGRDAMLLPPLDKAGDVAKKGRASVRTDPDVDATSSSSSSSDATTLPDMSYMSPLLQAHFSALMPNDSASPAVAAEETSSTALPTGGDHSRRAIAEATARLAMEEIAAMQRAVGELEHYMAVGNRNSDLVESSTAESSDLVESSTAESSDLSEEEDVEDAADEVLVNAPASYDDFKKRRRL